MLHNNYKKAFFMISIMTFSSCNALNVKKYQYKGYFFVKRCSKDLTTADKNLIVNVLQKLNFDPANITIELKTKCSDGSLLVASANSYSKTLYINPKEFKKLHGKLFVIAHECMHILFNDNHNDLCIYEQEKRADIQAAIKLVCARHGIAYFKQQMRENRNARWWGDRDYDKHGNYIKDTDHPKFSDRIAYLEPIAQSQT